VGTPFDGAYVALLSLLYRRVKWIGMCEVRGARREKVGQGGENEGKSGSFGGLWAGKMGGNVVMWEGEG
jgi:hypothetical protein